MSKLIEKEGRFYKKCVIVMLETEDCTNIHKDKRANSYPKLQKPSFLGGIWKNDPNHYQNVQATRDGLQENFHLSITSDDDIKEGDWYFDFISQTIRQCEDEQRVRLLKVAKHLGNKKIIATTDTLLINECEGCEITGGAVKGKVYNCSCKSLPQPSDKFIQAYIEAYNKGEKIEKVLVEYVIHPNSFVPLRIPKLKDNNIIIKKTKDSWSREEVVAILFKTMDYNLTPDCIEQWIEENL